MRLLFDAQCIQSSSSLRGIGRYALSLLAGLTDTAAEHGHEVEVLLNAGDDPERLLRARTAVETLVPPSGVHVFDAPWPWLPPYGEHRRLASEAAYAAAVRSLAPDVLLVGSVIESDEENVVTLRSPALGTATAAVLYDVIPAIKPETYLLGPGAESYWRRLDVLCSADHLLSISEHSAAQARRALGDRCPPTTAVWGGPYLSGRFPGFEATHADDFPIVLPDRYVLVVGGDHPRKNLDRLVVAWSQVPQEARAGTPLVVACRLNPGTVRRLTRTARRCRLGPQDLLIIGGVSEPVLERLYAEAHLFVFPSLEEGLGMPPLEAMASGCPTLLARGSSLSELSANPATYFDGLDTSDMARAVTTALTDEEVRAALTSTAASSAATFTWQRTAVLAWAALGALPRRTYGPAPDRLDVVALSDEIAVAGLPQRPGPVLVDRAEGPDRLRERLTAATWISVPDVRTASAVVAAGVVDVPIVLSHDAENSDRLQRHDFYAAYAAALEPLDLPPEAREAIVAAAVRTPRWMLERPRPICLLLLPADEQPSPLDELDAPCDVVVAEPDGWGLALGVDQVIVRAQEFAALEGGLALARRHGTRVTVVVPRDDPLAVPAFCRSIVLSGPASSPASWHGVLTTERTTGWPWQGSGA